MNKKVLSIVIAIGLAAACGLNATAQAVEGGMMPAFSLRTGGGKSMESSALRGFFVVMFYETKEKTELNRELKNRLNLLYEDLPPETRAKVIRLAAIDCTWAVWPFTAIWEHEMEKSARKEGMDIWGDWGGSARKSLGFKENEVYTLIMDDAGRIRFLVKGKLDAARIVQAEAIVAGFGN